MLVIFSMYQIGHQHPGLVINISNLSSTHLISNIRHEQQFKDIVDTLKMSVIVVLMFWSVNNRDCLQHQSSTSMFFTDLIIVVTTIKGCYQHHFLSRQPTPSKDLILKYLDDFIFSDCPYFIWITLYGFLYFDIRMILISLNSRCNQVYKKNI